MSLRGRLIVLIALTNLLVLGVLYASTAKFQTEWLERQVQKAQDHMDILQQNYVLPSDLKDLPAGADVRDLLRRGNFRAHFRDILIQSPALDFNPLGSAHRDFTEFPMAAIRAGIRQAMATRGLVNVAGGRCMAIESGSGVVQGGAWFVPLIPPEPQMTFDAYAIPLVIGVLVFSLLVGWIIGRTIGPPMQQLGAVARQFEAGDYSARVPAISAPELKTVVEAFNAMAKRVEGHTDALKSEVARATEEASAKERALVVSSRLASMGTLAAGVAHEINNPIGGMLNAVHRLRSIDGRSEKEETYLALIQQGLERVARTSRKLLDFTPRTIAPVAFSLEDAVAAAREFVEHRLVRQGVVFESEFAADLPPVLGEPHEIQQVVLNLFLNSLNALGDRRDGKIRVRGARVDDAVTNMIELCVEDNGPGVDAAILPRIMDPFFSGSNAPDATGLGLFICYTIVQNHGGSMTVESALGDGFRARIVLPVVSSSQRG